MFFCVCFFFSIWVFFYGHSRFPGMLGKGEGISLTPHYHFHPLYRHLDINQEITAESSPLDIASSRTQNGNLWFISAESGATTFATTDWIPVLNLLSQGNAKLLRQLEPGFERTSNWNKYELEIEIKAQNLYLDLFLFRFSRSE